MWVHVYMRVHLLHNVYKWIHLCHSVCIWVCVWEHTCATACPSVSMSVRWQTCSVVCTCVCIWGYTYISHGVHICMCVRWGTLVPQCSCGGPRNTTSVHPHLPPCCRLFPFFRCLLDFGGQLPYQLLWLLLFLPHTLCWNMGTAAVYDLLGFLWVLWTGIYFFTLSWHCATHSLVPTSFPSVYSVHVLWFWKREKVYTAWRLCNFWGLCLLFKKTI